MYMVISVNKGVIIVSSGGLPFRVLPSARYLRDMGESEPPRDDEPAVFCF